MSEESAPPVAPEHLLERSKALSQTSNEHSRAGAQACILINGGAATAVIAYLAKDKIDAAIVPDVSYSLAGYAAGVFFGALMLVFATQCLDNWSLYWCFLGQDGKPTPNALSGEQRRGGVGIASPRFSRSACSRPQASGLPGSWLECQQHFPVRNRLGNRCSRWPDFRTHDTERIFRKALLNRLRLGNE